ncbi:MAG: SagB/ThcOx family dehydrogenase [Desulfuromonadaceae bacterium]
MRELMKDSLRTQVNFFLSDQNQGLPAPPLQKPVREGQELIPLPGEKAWEEFRGVDVVDAIADRRSTRSFARASLTCEELSFMLWATQGVKQVLGPGAALRNVPSAGCRHAFETYILVNKVDNLESGIYRYLALEHALVQEQCRDDIPTLLTSATLGQEFISSAPVVLVWAAVPYRSEWRYLETAHRVMLMDVGHICQNLYLACEAAQCCTCAVAAYHQTQLDRLLELDGEDEFCVYLAPVGKQPSHRT